MGRCSLPQVQLRAKKLYEEGRKSMRREKDSPEATQEKNKRRCKARHTKSTALQPHHAKDKRKQTMRSESDDMHAASLL